MLQEFKARSHVSRLINRWGPKSTEKCNCFHFRNMKKSLQLCPSCLLLAYLNSFKPIRTLQTMISDWFLFSSDFSASFPIAVLLFWFLIDYFNFWANIPIFVLLFRFLCFYSHFWAFISIFVLSFRYFVWYSDYCANILIIVLRFQFLCFFPISMLSFQNLCFYFKFLYFTYNC